MERYSSVQEAVQGSDAPQEVLDTLVLLDIAYLGFDGASHTGQLVIHKELADEVTVIFNDLLEKQFPIAKMVPVVAYGWNDDASMADNNSAAFNYRKIIGTDNLSNHSLGRAIDINPVQNPYYAKDGKIYPEDAVYDPEVSGTITDEIAQIFKDRGWTWLGDREANTDYQHFHKL